MSECVYPSCMMGGGVCNDCPDDVQPIRVGKERKLVPLADLLAALAAKDAEIAQMKECIGSYEDDYAVQCGDHHENVKMWEKEMVKKDARIRELEVGLAKIDEMNKEKKPMRGYIEAFIGTLRATETNAEKTDTWEAT